MKISIIFITFTFLIILQAKSQILADTTKEYKIIKKFLINKGEWNKAGLSKPASIGFRCLIDTLSNRPCGIYSFNRMSSDARLYFYFKNSDGKVKIITDSYLTSCLKELNSFFSTNNGCLSSIEAINYTSEVLNILKSKYEGDLH